MTTHDDFLSAIHADPEDDTVRLVFADWLDENGDPDRAEFIRGQIRLETLAPEDAGRQPLETRLNEILDRNWHRWLDPELLAGRTLHPWPESHLCTRHDTRDQLYLGQLHYRRGFPWSATPINWQGTGTLTRLLALYPLRELSVFLSHTPDPDIEELLQTPHLEQLHHLRLIADTDYFDNTPYSINAYYTVELRGALALAAAPQLSQLRRLILEVHAWNWREDKSVENVLRAAFGERLEIT